MPQRRNWTREMDTMLISAWVHGRSMDMVEKETKISRTSLYRRAEKLGLKAREPQKRHKKKYFCRPPIPSRGEPLVRDLFRIMEKQRCSISEVAERSGVTRETIGTWGRGASSPLFSNFRAVLNALGYELVVRELEDA